MTETEKNEVRNIIEKAYKQIITKQKGSKKEDIENQKKSLEVTVIPDICIKDMNYNYQDILNDSIFYMLKNLEKFSHIKDEVQMKYMIKAITKRKERFALKSEKIRAIYIRDGLDVVGIDDSQSLQILENIESK